MWVTWNNHNWLFILRRNRNIFIPNQPKYRTQNIRIKVTSLKLCQPTQEILLGIRWEIKIKFDAGTIGMLQVCKLYRNLLFSVIGRQVLAIGHDYSPRH